MSTMRMRMKNERKMKPASLRKWMMTCRICLILTRSHSIHTFLDAHLHHLYKPSNEEADLTEHEEDDQWRAKLRPEDGGLCKGANASKTI
jgi:hypothetical protein